MSIIQKEENKHFVNTAGKRIGLFFLLGGILIFITWFIPRYFFAYNFQWSELVGLYWVLAGFYICSAALFLWFLLFLRNLITNAGTQYSALPWLLINIPVSILIITFVLHDSKYTYISLSNYSNSNLHYYIVDTRDTLAQGEIGTIFNNVDRIDYTPYLERTSRERNTLSLILDNGNKLMKIELQNVGRGACKRYQIKPDLILE